MIMIQGCQSTLISLALPGGQVDKWSVLGHPHLGRDVLLQALLPAGLQGSEGVLIANLHENDGEQRGYAQGVRAGASSGQLKTFVWDISGHHNRTTSLTSNPCQSSSRLPMRVPLGHFSTMPACKMASARVLNMSTCGKFTQRTSQTLVPLASSTCHINGWSTEAK